MKGAKRYVSIHDAVKDGNVVELESMVKMGASINEVEERDKFTPLHTACNFGALECLHWLLWHGADATVTTPKGWTPAHIASIRGQDACMQALVNNGVSMSSKDSRGSTPAHLSAAHGNSFTLSTILRSGVDINATDKNGWTGVHSACYHGRLGCLQLLLKWGGNVEETDSMGNTPAHFAASEGHIPCLKFLVSSGVSPMHVLGARNDQGETPKDLAQQFYKDHIIEYCNGIEWERDHPDEVENLSFPAHVAAYNGELDHLRMLVENGVVNINERDDKGGTPAHKAAGQGHIHVLQWLVEMGANMTIANQSGETPRDVARRFSQLACVRLLGGDPEQETEVVEDSDEEIADVNTEGKSVVRSERQRKEAKARARQKLEELDRLMEIAKKNYTQMGGVLPEDRRRMQEIRDKDKTINELETQLDYERLRREKLEAQLDQHRREIADLKYQLQGRRYDSGANASLAEHVGSSRRYVEDVAMSSDGDSDYIPRSRRKKTAKGKKSLGDDGLFIKRNVTVSKKGVKPRIV